MQNVQSDPLGIIGQVITGFGFLGAGVIMKKNGIIIGVTSASTIWPLVPISIFVVLGYRMTALKLSFPVLYFCPE